MKVILITFGISIWVTVLAIQWTYLLNELDKTANYWYQNIPKIIWLIAFASTFVLPFVYHWEHGLI